MTRRDVVVSIAFLFLIIAFTFPAFAKISIIPYNDPNLSTGDGVFTGTIVLTTPDGRITILEPGDPLPDFPSDSILEVFDGQFTVETQEGDQLTVSILGNEFIIAGGSTVTVIAGETEGKIIVRSGFARFSDTTGRISTIQVNQDFAVALGEPLVALPTAEGSPLGFQTGEEPVPDSRNIEASPST